MRDKVPSRRLLLQQVAAAQRRVPELPPCSAVAGLFILQTASFRSKTALGTQGNGRVYYKLSKGTDYCWRRSRVIKDWSGEEGEEGTGHNLCLCGRGWVLVASEGIPQALKTFAGFGAIFCSAYRAVSNPTYFLLYQSFYLCSNTHRRALAGPVLNELRSLPAQPSYIAVTYSGGWEKKVAATLNIMH